LGAVGIVTNVYLSVLKLGFGEAIGNRPLLLFGLLMTIVGVQLIAMGLLAELVMRVYYEGSSRTTYAIREVLEDQ